MKQEKAVTLKMVRYGTFVGVIGAWLLGMEKTKKQLENKEQKEQGDCQQEKQEQD